MDRVRVARPENTRIDLMLDSGAFSAWNQGSSVNLKQYIKFLKEFEKDLFCYVVLDVLPEGAEKLRQKTTGWTNEANERGAKLSDINQQKMKDAGLSPIPVFHQGEDFRWLERMLKNGETYIGISSRKDLTHKKVLPWLDDVWSVLVDSKGRPIVKTHGFGITAMPMLLRYPWFTTDSTTWALSAGFGLIYVPIQGKDGKPDYLQRPYQVVTSGSSQDSIGQQKKQYDQWAIFKSSAKNPTVQDRWVRKWIEEDCGMLMSDLRNNAKGRRQAILHYYLRMAEQLRDVRFMHQVRRTRQDWLDARHAALARKDRASIDHLRIMYATSYNKQFSQILNDAGARTRLISYYEIRDKDPELLLKYIEHGTVGEYERQNRKADWTSEQYLSHRMVRLAQRHPEFLPEQDEEPV